MKNLYHILIISVSISCFSAYSMENIFPKKDEAYTISTKYPQYNNIRKIFPNIHWLDYDKLQLNPQFKKD